jgi:signal transduction histidine kinase
MSLKKKIIIIFLISASIIAVLMAYEYKNFIDIRREIRYIELTDTIRSKTLQLRRHEKNFFLYGQQKSGAEALAVHDYLRQIEAILNESMQEDKNGRLQELKRLVLEYGKRFSVIEKDAQALTEELEKTKAESSVNANFFPLIELTFLDRPSEEADLLVTVFKLPPEHVLVTGLKNLDTEIGALRKSGEDILNVSKELDKSAREEADQAISSSQVAIIIFFPLFLVIGIGTLFYFASDTTSRLRLLMDVVEKAGMGGHPSVSQDNKRSKDEVGMLIEKFNHMEDQLAQRELEIEEKNQELLRAKKLVSIGTMAAGVAHELNNPLNNIYISAQVLSKAAGTNIPSDAKEVIGDIIGQTARVKRIVGDLLEFARGKEPRPGKTDLNGLIKRGYDSTKAVADTEKVTFRLEPLSGELEVFVDPGQMERVFINLFANAVEAMSGEGELTVTTKADDGFVRIDVSDTGPGIRDEEQERVFDPFYTTKEKGTGLGLAIAFNIVKKHGGDISVKSCQGRGSCFKIKLPVKSKDE